MYERFLKYPNLTSGSVLKHILKRKNLSQRYLAETAGVLPQRINDFINDKRKISAETSLAIEKALGIEIKCYFYLIQSNHDIYIAEEKTLMPSQPDLSRIRKSIFWDADMSKINWQTNVKAVVQRVFEYGDDEAVDEIIKFYSPDTVSSILRDIHSTRFPERIAGFIKKFRL